MAFYFGALQSNLKMLIFVFFSRIFLHSRRRFAHTASDIALARIMMALVFIFLLLNLPRLGLGLYEVIQLPLNR